MVFKTFKNDKERKAFLDDYRNGKMAGIYGPMKMRWKDAGGVIT